MAGRQDDEAAGSTEMVRIDRYLAIERWAQRRYRRLHPKGWLTIRVGGQWSAYSRIENAAFDRYIRQVRRG